jgi:hypothetical protein
LFLSFHIAAAGIVPTESSRAAFGPVVKYTEKKKKKKNQSAKQPLVAGKKNSDGGAENNDVFTTHTPCGAW